MGIFTFLLLFLVVFAPGPVTAAEKLDFDNGQIGEVSRNTINRYFQANLGKAPADILIAPTDLNGDGLNEFVIREKSCDPGRNLCDYKILSETGGTIAVLGEISARTLALGNQYSQGVRSLMAFESRVNDYEYAVYVWEPRQARYTIEKQK